MVHPSSAALVIVEDAGLQWVTDAEPGIRRVRRGRGFVYLSPGQRRAIADRATIARITKLAIPPAWTDVWICPDPRGHIQATGRDARGRKQYRYHATWRSERDQAKYEQLESFGRALPAIRRRVKVDLARPGIPREKVLAALVTLLERTLIRVGNDEYARANRSYGLTTLHDRHVSFAGAKIRFSFRGKSGIARVLELEDPQLARVVKRCQDVPGQTLFQYIDEAGNVDKVGSGDVNGYLREISRAEFTAKYFRTWGGTLSVMCALAKAGQPATQAEAKRADRAAIQEAAEMLGNTPAVCRNFYVHPAVLEAYREGKLPDDACSARRGAREKALMSILSSARRTRRLLAA